jgi:PEGA domain
MSTKTLTAAALILLTVVTCAWCRFRIAAQGKDASRPTQGPGATPSPARAPRRPRRHKPADGIRRSTPRFVTVTIVSNLPYCDVEIDGEIEDKGTDGQGRLSIPMVPGTYDVQVSKKDYVPDGREVEVKVSPNDRQEESFTLVRGLIPLKVKTNPPGVKVSLDGSREAESDADGLLTFNKVDPSVQHSLRATKENYRDESVIVSPYKMEAMIRLSRDLLTLKVKTEPPQADVSLDGMPQGTSDSEGVLTIARVKTDKEHSLRAAKEGYITQTVTVPPNYEFTVIKLPPVSGEPSPSAGRSSPATQSGQARLEDRPDTKGSDERRPATADTQQSVATRQGHVTPPAPQNGENRSPAPQKSEQDGSPAPLLEVELAFWNSIKDSKNPEEFAAYLRRYPHGQFAELATIRMNALSTQKSTGPEPTSPTPEPAKPAPTPTSTPSPTPTPLPAPTPELPPVSAQGVPLAPDVKSPSTGGASDAPMLEDTIDWLRKNFGAKFTYHYTESQQSPGGVPLAKEESIDFEPLRFEGCSFEWRVFDDVHRVSLSDLDPLSVKVEPRSPPSGTYFSKEIWDVLLAGEGGKAVFEKMEGGGGVTTKRYWRLVLLYDDKERADKVAAAFRRAIDLCVSKGRP